MTNQTTPMTAIISAANSIAPAIEPRKKATRKTTTPALAKALQATTEATAAQVVVTNPEQMDKATEAYALFSALKGNNEAIYAFFEAHVNELFKDTKDGRQTDAAGAYKKLFNVNHTRGAATPLKEYPLYKEFTNKLAYWIKNVAKISTAKVASGTPTNAVAAYLKKKASEPNTIGDVRDFLAGSLTPTEWAAFRDSLDNAFKSATQRTVSKVK